MAAALVAPQLQLSWDRDGVTILVFALVPSLLISHADDDPAGRTMKRWLLKLAFRVGMPLALWPVKLLAQPRSKASR